MTFQFDSLQAFGAMAGHGPYVWFCYGAVWLCLLWLMLSPRWRFRRIVKTLDKFQRIEQQSQQQAAANNPVEEGK